MEVKIDDDNEALSIYVHPGISGCIVVRQMDDLIYIKEENIRTFVAAVRDVASDILGEEL